MLLMMLLLRLSAIQRLISLDVAGMMEGFFFTHDQFTLCSLADRPNHAPLAPGTSGILAYTAAVLAGAAIRMECGLSWKFVSRFPAHDRYSWHSCERLLDVGHNTSALTWNAFWLTEMLYADTNPVATPILTAVRRHDHFIPTTVRDSDLQNKRHVFLGQLSQSLQLLQACKSGLTL